MSLVSRILAYVVQESFCTPAGPPYPTIWIESVEGCHADEREEKDRFIAQRQEFTVRHDIQPAVTIYQLTYRAGHPVGKRLKYKELAV